MINDNYSTYFLDDGEDIYIRYPNPVIVIVKITGSNRSSNRTSNTFRLTLGPYCKPHKDMLREKFKICELEHARYFIYPKYNSETGDINETHYAVSKPKIVGVILGWYVKVKDD